VVSKPVDVGSLSFSTQGGAQKFFSDLLRDLPLGPVPEKWAGEIAALLMLHPHADEKIGAGIDHVKVRMSPEGYYRSKQFAVARIDGTEEEFSYRECIRASTPWDDLKTACRRAVDPQIKQARDTTFEEGLVYCDACGAPLPAIETAVDHVAPWTFDAIVRAYFRMRCYREADWPQLVRDTESGAVLATEGLLRDFCEFHDRIATLRLVHASRDCHPVHRFKPPQRPLRLVD
jgi:hypothetical protein